MIAAEKSSIASNGVGGWVTKATRCRPGDGTWGSGDDVTSRG